MKVPNQTLLKTLPWALLLVGAVYGCQADKSSPEKTKPAGALPGGDCATGWQCQEFGHCTAEGDWCVVGSAEECAQSLGCTMNGWCGADMETGWCVAQTTAHCEGSQICTSREACTPHGPCCSQNCLNEVVEDTWSETAGDTVGYTDIIQSIYQRHCTPCHQGEVSEGCAGGTCLASFYTDTLLDSYLCEGVTMAECALTRLLSVKDPDTEGGLIGSEVYIIIPEPELAIMAAWVELGMPE